MIKIIHVSDLHLESNNPSFEKKEIINAFALDIKKYVDDTTLLFFTGDAIDKGGVGFIEERDKSFLDFEEVFINRILEHNSSLKNRIFVVPGNHDIFRDKIDPISEDGLKSNLITPKNVTDFIKNNRNNTRHLERIADYKNWEKSFYALYPNSNCSLFENTFIIKIGIHNVGITCLNSSWLCKDDNDKENLIIGKNQIENSLEKIKNCQVKVALSHHPIEFLNEIDRDLIKRELYKYYDILFTGHVHELASSYTQDLYGNIFISIANSTIGEYARERKYANGYSIIEYLPNDKIKTLYRKYVEVHKKFVPNTEIGTEDGTKEWQILKDDTLAKFEIVATLVDEISNKYCEKLNEHLIMAANNTSAPYSIDYLFVEPTVLNYPQYAMKENETINYNIETILNRNTNFLIYGLKESGKTILIDKLFLESVKRFNQLNKVPIYLKFSDLKNKDIEIAIKDFISKPKDQVSEILNENDSILFIDDIAFSGKYIDQICSLKKLVIKYPKIQIVATSDLFLESTIPTDYLTYNDVLNFEVGFIQNLNSHEIKEFIRKWFYGKEVDFQENMGKLIKSFIDFGLPKTPLSVTMFLWIFEKQENRPLNNSVLVEMFIENLLEKTNIENVYSETFDFTNKKRFLSFIAKFMRDNGDGDLSYSVNYVDLLTFANNYLKTRFSGKPQKVLDDLIRRGVLCYEEDNLVRFKSAFFFHYFLALQFDYDSEFRNHVLKDENYLDYIEEIVYYTGLKRDDVDFLTFTQQKLNEAFGEFNIDVSNNHEKVDRVLETSKKTETLAFNLPDDKMETKPSDKQMDEVYDNQLSAIPVQKTIPKKTGNNFTTKINIDKVLKLASNVLKNSEDVDDYESKIQAYKNTILSTISCMIQERDALILYYAQFKKKPDHLPKNVDFNLFIKVIPLIYQVVIYNWLGSQKLRPVLTDKMDMDKQTINISEFEKFLSIFIYSDVKGSDYPEIIEEFLKTVKSNYIKDLSFFKILSYYYLRNNTPELNARYLEMLYKIKKDMGQVSKQSKYRFLNNIKEQKKD